MRGSDFPDYRGTVSEAISTIQDADHRGFGLAMMIMLINSFRFDPDSSSNGDFIARAQRKSDSGITVDASALGARESQRSFGENLASHGIQPVWLSIENNTDQQYVFLSIAMDPEYYSPHEVSYRFHGIFRWPQIARATRFLSSVRYRASCRLTRAPPVLCTAKWTPALSTLEFQLSERGT